MATEIARIDIQPGTRAAFLAAAEEAVDLFRAAPGCRSMRIGCSHEVADRFWLIVEWRDVAAHETFRTTPAFARWRELVGPYFSGAPQVEHAVAAIVGF